MRQYLPSPQSPPARPPELWRSVPPAGNGRYLKGNTATSLRDQTSKQIASIKANTARLFVAFTALKGALKDTVMLTN